MVEPKRKCTDLRTQPAAEPAIVPVESRIPHTRQLLKRRPPQAVVVVTGGLCARGKAASASGILAKHEERCP